MKEKVGGGEGGVREVQKGGGEVGGWCRHMDLMELVSNGFRVVRGVVSCLIRV